MCIFFPDPDFSPPTDDPPPMTTTTTSGLITGRTAASHCRCQPAPPTPHPHTAFLSFSYPGLPPPLPAQFCGALPPCHYSLAVDPPSSLSTSSDPVTLLGMTNTVALVGSPIVLPQHVTRPPPETRCCRRPNTPDRGLPAPISSDLRLCLATLPKPSSSLRE